MENGPSQHPTQFLTAGKAGGAIALSEATDVVYQELLRLARCHLHREPPPSMLEPTALVNEAYLRLFSRAASGWKSRDHFFNAAARAMRDLVVEHGRRHAARKRGGGRRRVALDERVLCTSTQTEDLLALDEALRWLQTNDAEGAQIVMLRYFAGLTLPNTAEAMGLSVATVKRVWCRARDELRRRMLGEEHDGRGARS